MKEHHFDMLLESLRDRLTVSIAHSCSSTSGNEPICPEVILACGLRFLGLGENAAGLADMYGMSVSSAKRVVKMFLNPIDFYGMTLSSIGFCCFLNPMGVSRIR